MNDYTLISPDGMFVSIAKEVAKRHGYSDGEKIQTEKKLLEILIDNAKFNLAAIEVMKELRETK